MFFINFIRSFFILFLLLTTMHCSHFVKRDLKKKDLKVGLVMGPGGARSFGALGVLQVLKENNIPMDHIVGMGWGSWVGAVFSKNMSVDEVKWSLHKLSKRGVFKNYFFKNPLRSPKNISSLKLDLDENFDSNSLNQLPFSCPVINRQGKLLWQTQDYLKKAVRNCLNIPHFFKSSSELSGSLLAVHDTVSYLKKQGVDLIIWIHPLKNEEFHKMLFKSDSNWTDTKVLLMEWVRLTEQISSDPLVIEVDLNLPTQGIYDFSKINEIILQGRKAGVILVNKLQTLFDL